MIKFQHSLFALPFALTGALAAAGGLPALGVFLRVMGCMVTARTAAMTWNRIADLRYDAANPRTRDRALPAGRVDLGAAWVLLVASVLLFLAFAASLNRLTLLLAPVALLVVLGYSLTKRFTWASHFALGAALAIAPSAAWIAVRGSLAWEPVILSAAVIPWVAGFDIVYACQDVDADRASGLHSLPARFGVPTALRVALACHVLAFVGLVAFGAAAPRGPAYFACVAAAGCVLGWSHRLVTAGDLSRLQVAFFHANVAVGGLVLLGMALDVLG